MRQKRDIKRPEGKWDANLIIIATEGRETEKIYFNDLREKFEATDVHVKVLEKLDNKSSPEDVLGQLDQFKKEYNLKSADELWMVIDRDYQSWEFKMIRIVAQKCHQKPGYFLGLSNPCFEIWLMLHLTDVIKYSKSEKDKLFENQKVSKQKTYCKDKIGQLLGKRFNEANYDPSPFIDNVQVAIERAKKLDVNPKSRWPEYLGTRVHRLVKRII